MKHKSLATLTCIVSVLLVLISIMPANAETHSKKDAPGKPNIVFILADDLGYGDVQCLNPKRGKIPTPNIDRLATQGMMFTDAHSTSSVCTPTRYSVLTGRYNWRSRLQHGVLSPYASSLISAGQLTVPGMLKTHAYHTACIGKWHLGMHWPKHDGKHNFSEPAIGGPTDHGFDWYYGVNIPGYPPHCFIENDQTVGIPSVALPKSMFVWGGANGAAVPGFTFESMLPTLTEKACEYIQRRAAAKQPFFLYYALSSPHHPVTPNKEWIGKSGLGRYADFVMETDAMVGKVLSALADNGVADNTLVIFTSDNGCSPIVGGAITNPDPRAGRALKVGHVHRLEAKGHFPSGNFRGYKSDIWDGGHRIPFMVRWPGQVKPGTTCGQLVCEMDLMATCADLLDIQVPPNAGEDSVSFLSLLRGENQPVRESLVHHSIQGRFAIRDGKWKLALSPGSGGWGAPSDTLAQKRRLPAVQLYDMSVDQGERNNLEAEHPYIVKRLTETLEKIVDDGRSTPGPKQENDVAVNVFKDGKND